MANEFTSRKKKILGEIEACFTNASDLWEIPDLSAEKIDKLAEILMMPEKAASVEQVA